MLVDKKQNHLVVAIQITLGKVFPLSMNYKIGLSLKALDVNKYYL